MAGKTRCPWAGDDPLYQRYHDEEWGVPQHDDHRLFELITLEGAQAGLSWITVLRKRERYRAVFHGFDPERVVRMTPRALETALTDPGIIRHRGKVESTVSNARAVLAIQHEFRSLDAYLWSFVDGKPIVNMPESLAEVPATTPVSDALSADLKSRGFRFVGSTICYALMQATGMVNDHLVSCFRSTHTRRDNERQEETQ
ncbi:MAG: DNA-3-methyladenine glycosylase I [Gammaproteobacteria bacterium]